MMLELKKDMFADIQEKPREHYRFQIDPNQLLPVMKKGVVTLVKRKLTAVLSSLCLMLFGLYAGEFVFGMGFGLFVFLTFDLVSSISSYKKGFVLGSVNYMKTV